MKKTIKENIQLLKEQQEKFPQYRISEAYLEKVGRGDIEMVQFDHVKSTKFGVSI